MTRLIDGIGARPWGIGVSPDRARLFTANDPSNDVSVIDRTHRRPGDQAKVGGLPRSLIVAPGR